MVKNQCEAECIAVFGDHNNPDYGAALGIYYQNGAKENWQKNYISGYATMHPWEGFAESFAAYLDTISVNDIAFHTDALHGVEPIQANFVDISKHYAKLGLLFNEMNRAKGLLDLVPRSTRRAFSIRSNLYMSWACATQTLAIPKLEFVKNS